MLTLCSKGDIVIVDGMPYTVFQDDNLFNGQAYIVRIGNDYNPRFTVVNYLVEQNQIEAALTNAQLNCLLTNMEKYGNMLS